VTYISGEANMPTPPAPTRLAAYEFLLENMTDHQRLEAASKLQRDVVGAMLDGVIPVTGESAEIDVLVCDTFAALGLDNMRVRGNAKTGGAGSRSATAGMYNVTMFVCVFAYFTYIEKN
jgi:hypothetical protein